MKYYAVRTGRKTGIFTSWDECKKQVSGYSGAEYKSFATKKEAEAFLGSAKAEAVGENALVAYVDGSFNAKKRLYGYGCVLIKNGQVIQKIYGKGQHPDYVGMRNVAGEIFGSEVAIEYAIENGYDEVIVYYDYMGIEKWATKKWQANKPGTKAYQEKCQDYFQKIHVVFEKVAAHTGVTYNEMADGLAKKAVGIA